MKKAHTAQNNGYLISSFCEQGGCSNCVAVKLDEDGISVLDTKNPKHALSFARAEWSAFIEGVKNGEFDLNT